MRKNAHIRLYCDETLTTDREILFEGDKFHYLCRVMRARRGFKIFLFNENDGEWEAIVGEPDKRGGEVSVTVGEQTEQPQPPSPLTLYFSPIKRTPMAFLVQKATELGVGKLVPCLFARSITESFRVDHWRRVAEEAAEQSERVNVPEFDQPTPLEEILADYPHDAVLLHCDEKGDGKPIIDVLRGLSEYPKTGVLIGPEGGMTNVERDMIAELGERAARVGLGPRILKAETAAVAALTCCQSYRGDWNAMPRFNG